MSNTDGLPAAQRRWVMACLLLGVVLAGLDSAIANIALPTIGRELVASEAATVWVVNSFQLGLTIFLLPASSVADAIGLKRVYAFGLGLFTLASLCCALAPNLAVLVAARLVQGIGASCMAALGGALVRAIYPRAALGQGFALLALAVAISGAAGPSIGAGILAIATWPWLFLVNVPLGVVGLVLFLAIAPNSATRKRSLDFVGALLNAVALGLVVIGVDGLGGPARSRAVLECVAGLAAGGMLFWQQSRQKAPMLPLDLLRIPLFALSVGASMCAYAAQMLAYVSLPFLFQTVMHRSAVAAGLLITPWPLAVAVAAPFAGRLSARYPAALLSSIGLAVLSGGMVLLATMPALPAEWDVAWRMSICGVGFGFYQTPNNLALMTAGPPERSGAASGMLAVARTVGWSLGAALVALIFGLRGGAGAYTCLQVGAAIAGFGGLISVSRTRARRAAA